MIRIAQIINTRGLKGECKLKLFTDQDELRFAKGRPLWLDEKTRLTVQSYSVYKGFGYVRFEEVQTLEEAEKLKGKTLWLPKEELGELEEDEFYYHELDGCRVINEKGEDTGTVIGILETGANLVLRVSGAKGEYLLPFVDAFVQEVDREKKQILIEEQEGLR